MIRAVLVLCLLCVLPVGALAQDDGACLVAQTDMTVTVAPEQTLVWRVSGGAHIYDVTAKLADLSVTTTGDAIVYSAPSASDEATELAVIPAEQPVDVYGRSEAGDWLYIGAPENVQDAAAGWVSTDVVRADGDISALPVISPDNPARLYPAYQAVRIPAETCVASDIDGALAQAVNDDYVLFVVNGVEIRLIGTAFIRPLDDETLTVSVIDGRAIAGNAHIPAGATATIVPETETTLAPYDELTLLLLPLDVRFGSDFGDASVAVPLPADGIEDAVRKTFASHGLLDGYYAVSVIEFVETTPGTSGSGGYCFSGGADLNGLYVTDARANGIDAPLEIISMREFTFEHGYEDEQSACQVKHYAEWVAAQ